MSSKFWSKKGGNHTCLARPIQHKTQIPREVLKLNQYQDPIASAIPPPGTPINIVQKPNGKLAAEVPKPKVPSPQELFRRAEESRKKREQSRPVPLGGRKPKPFNPKKLREYINKIKK